MMQSLLPLLLLSSCAPAAWQTDKLELDTGTPSLDADRDGWTVDEDCDDADDQSHPGALEICDQKDNDCDGEIDEDVGTTWYMDFDSDGYGDPLSTITACDMPEGYVPTATDCDDADADTWPGAPERCDELDNDCDGSVDEDVLETWYGDSDGDGYGDPGASVELCDPDDDWVDNSSDCEDSDADIHPDATEECDLVDNDCDGEVDEDVRETWYMDSDGDGYGDADSTTESCTQPVGYVADSTDCDDSTAAVSPASSEICDELDNDCDGSVDEDEAIDAEVFYRDADGDGFGNADSSTLGCEPPSGYLSVGAGEFFDCDDTSASIHPDAEERCDELDNDCDGYVDDEDSEVTDTLTWYLDFDGDGYGTDRLTAESCEAPSGYVSTDDDCDDTSADVMPDPAGGCALGTTCLDILDYLRDDGDGDYTIDPDGWDAGLDPFDVYCEMEGDDPGWTEIAYTDDLAFDQHFSSGNTWQTLPDDFELELSDEQIDAIRDQSTEGRQKYEGRCEGVVHHYYTDRDSYVGAFGFVFHDGSMTVYGEEDYSPHDVSILEDGCKANGGEGGSSHQATWFKIKDTALPIVNVVVWDGGDSGEEFGSLLQDNSAWLR